MGDARARGGGNVGGGGEEEEAAAAAAAVGGSGGGGRGEERRGAGRGGWGSRRWSPLTRWPPLDKRGGSAVDQGKRRSLVAAVPSSPLPCTLISGPRPLTRERDAGCKFWRFLFFMEHNSVKYS